MRLLLLLLLAALLGGCSSQMHVEEEPDTEVKPDIEILYIGNSLTYTHDVPSQVNECAKDKGLNVGSKVVASPNYALEDHWNEGRIQTLIKSGQYKYVVIQQGPSSQRDGRESLMEYGRRIKELCDEAGSELAYYMVWPSVRYFSTYSGVIKNYADAAEANGAILIPVGVVWKEYYDETSALTYYGPDEFHASPAGAAVAAQVICDTLFP